MRAVGGEGRWGGVGHWRGEGSEGKGGSVGTVPCCTASPHTYPSPLTTAPSSATFKSLSDTGVCCSGVPHLTPTVCRYVLVCVVCGETHRQHRLVVTPVTSSLRDTHTPVSSTAAIIWRKGRGMYTDHSQNMHIATNTACTKSSNMRHSFNTLQTTVLSATADVFRSTKYTFSCLCCTSSLLAMSMVCPITPVNCQTILS